MSKILPTLTFMTLLLFSGCKRNTTVLHNTEWLLGTWQSTTSKGVLYETWQKADGHNFIAKSYYLNNADTILFETIQLKENEGILLYIVSAPKESNEKPVQFASINLTANSFIFENKLNEFPQIICYKKITSDSLVAEVSGKYKGEIMKEEFIMKKIK